MRFHLPPVLYPSLSWLQFDSEDEREEVEAQKALAHKIHSQSIKKSKKNQARLPRTAGLRTLSELSTELKKAGYDPSSIEARAGMLAKVQAAKRKRAETDMDVDMDDAEEADEGDEGEGEGEWMDVDDEEPPTSKRAKGNSGAIVAKNSRAPRTNRQLAGMRDDQVNDFCLYPNMIVLIRCITSKHPKPSSYATWVNANVTCTPKLERVIVLSGSKRFISLRMWFVLQHLTLVCVAKAFVFWQAEGRQDQQTLILVLSMLSVGMLLFSSIHEMIYPLTINLTILEFNNRRTYSGTDFS